MADGGVPLWETADTVRDVERVRKGLLRWNVRSQRLMMRLVLFSSYENEDVALNTGMILRDMLRHEPVAKVLLYSDQFYNFPQYIEDTTFGISCDAFTNFKETLTRHKPMVAVYLDSNYDRVCFL